MARKIKIHPSLKKYLEKYFQSIKFQIRVGSILLMQTNKYFSFKNKLTLQENEAKKKKLYLFFLLSYFLFFFSLKKI